MAPTARSGLSVVTGIVTEETSRDGKNLNRANKFLVVRLSGIGARGRREGRYEEEKEGLDRVVRGSSETVDGPSTPHTAAASSLPPEIFCLLAMTGDSPCISASPILLAAIAATAAAMMAAWWFASSEPLRMSKEPLLETVPPGGVEANSLPGPEGVRLIAS